MDGQKQPTCTPSTCDCGGDVLQAYRNLLNAGELKPDAAQEEVVQALSRLSQIIAQGVPQQTETTGYAWMDRLRRKLSPQPEPVKIRGLYIWGDVGRGKSFLMDLFHQNLSTCRKRRLHFHEFMREVHERLHMIRRQPKTNARDDRHEPLQSIAEMLASTTRVLCLDELEVHDIGDAMIVGKLFEALLAQGVVVLTTSNRPPKDLYKDGLQREKFVPFIDLIYREMDIVHLAASRDYRLGRLQGAELYLSPLGCEVDLTLDKLFNELAGSNEIRTDSIPVKGRHIPVPRTAGSVAEFDFTDLCAKPLGTIDYMEIAARYQAVILRNVPKMGQDHAAEARRFVTLVDIFYDHRVKLIISAEALPDELYDGGKGGFEFQRTVSRLIEMQAEDYIVTPHVP